MQFIPMKEAVATYCEVMSPRPGVRTEAQLDCVAERLARLVPLYAGDGRALRALPREELRGGRFARGGGEWVFQDGRPSIRGLATTRDALDAAIALKRASSGLL